MGPLKADTIIIIIIIIIKIITTNGKLMVMHISFCTPHDSVYHGYHLDRVGNLSPDIKIIIIIIMIIILMGAFFSVFPNKFKATQGRKF